MDAESSSRIRAQRAMSAHASAQPGPWSAATRRNAIFALLAGAALVLAAAGGWASSIAGWLALILAIGILAVACFMWPAGSDHRGWLWWTGNTTALAGLVLAALTLIAHR